MGKLSSFTFITLNGFYKGANEDIGWHKHGAEEGEYAKEGAQSNSILLFGRVTYQMMAGYWPTPMAMEQNPGVAAGMNASEKILFSRTLKNAEWSNTRLVKENIVDEIKKMKKNFKADLTILGSGSIVAQCADAGLIDEFQIMLDPVALGGGTPIFNTIKKKLDLQLTKTKEFKSGVVLLCYKPA